MKGPRFAHLCVEGLHDCVDLAHLEQKKLSLLPTQWYCMCHINVKTVPSGHWGGWGAGRGTARPILSVGDRRGRVVNATPRPLYSLEKRHGTHCTGDWGGRVWMGQENLALGFETRNDEPVTSCFTDWAVPAAHFPCDVVDFVIDLAIIFFLQGFSSLIYTN